MQMTTMGNPTGDDDAEWRAVAEALAGEVAAVRQRLAAAEQALGLPTPPGRSSLASVPDLSRRLAALERQAGVIPGLVPLTGGYPSQRPVTPLAIVASASAERRADWATWGGVALVGVLVVLLVVWPVKVPTPPVVATPLPSPLATPRGLAVPARPIAPLSVPAAPADLSGLPAGTQRSPETCPLPDERVCVEER